MKIAEIFTWEYIIPGIRGLGNKQFILNFFWIGWRKVASLVLNYLSSFVLSPIPDLIIHTSL